MNYRRALFRAALGQRAARYDGDLKVDGLKAPVEIRRDRYAIPHIRAGNDEDAWFALGFCQGQDRAFQLELRLRMVRGTLSALVGKATLPIDRLSRRLGLRYAAERQLAVLAPEVRTQVEAFARGVNAGVSRGAVRRAHEFTLLRGRPTAWEGADVIGVGKLMSFLLIGNWDVELARLQILRLDGEQALRDLNPAYPAEHGISVDLSAKAGPAIDRLSEDLALFVGLAGRAGGSNAWAVSGTRTKTGRPLLANDPHLEPLLPPHWYLAHIETPDWSVAGAALVGGPAIGCGHNGYAAWGITAALTDTVDLFLEEVGPDGRSVRQGDTFVPCEVRREVIEVKGAAPVVEEVLETPRGPLIGPALTGEVGALSMSAVWLQPRPVRGFLTAHKARSFEAFRAEFAQWPLLNQSVVYADATGRIAWQLTGEVPVRKRGWGTLPQPGWAPDTGWQEATVPLSEMPWVADPAVEFVASANNAPVQDGEGPYLGVDFIDGFRFERIKEVLSARDDWDVASMAALQLDATSLPWRGLRETVLALPAESPEARLGLDLLRAWDGVVAADSSAASVYELFRAEVWRRVATNRAPNASEYALGRGFARLLPFTTFAGGRFSRILRLVREQPPGWFEGGWMAELTATLDAVVRRLQQERGPDPAGWGWGSLRTLTLEHPVGSVQALAPLFNRGPFRFQGDGDTVAQAGWSPLAPLSNPGVIASLRAVIDVGNWDESRFSLPGGQSGNPLSPHYDDLLPLWQCGDGVPVAWSAEAVAEATRHMLRLRPI